MRKGIKRRQAWRIQCTEDGSLLLCRRKESFEQLTIGAEFDDHEKHHESSSLWTYTWASVDRCQYFIRNSPIFIMLSYDTSLL